MSFVARIPARMQPVISKPILIRIAGVMANDVIFLSEMRGHLNTGDYRAVVRMLTELIQDPSLRTEVQTELSYFSAYGLLRPPERVVSN